MNRNVALLALFAVSLGAGVWMFRVAPPADVAAPESCADGGTCSAELEPAMNEPPVAETGVAEPIPEAAAPAAAPAPAPSAAAPRPAPPPPADGKALRAEADRLLAEGHALEGIDKLRQATEADPSAKNHGDLGDLLERGTAMDEALVHLRQAAELDPGNADRWIALANAYYHAVDPGEAWKAEKRAKEAEPGLVLGRDKSGRRVRQGDSAPRKP